MTGFKKVGMLIAAVIIMSWATELGESQLIKGTPSLVSTAEAVVGRPLTPVSVAGAARRTGRRCATGVYNC